MTTAVSENSEIVIPEQNLTRFEKALENAAYYVKHNRADEAKESCQRAFDEARHFGNKILKGN